jgi:tripartite-type tricarboxylate transporter receptor subunit TctC
MITCWSKETKVRTAFRITIAACWLLLTNLAVAEYPERPIKLVVAFAAGSSTDVMARVYAEKLKELMGQPVMVDNRPGATGSIGADMVAKAPGDGYTLLLNSSALVINPWVSKPPFDINRDLAPVIRTAQTPYVLVVNPKLPINNFQEFIAYAKKNPGKLTCSTYGVASPPHLALELLKAAAGVDIVHAPYKSFGQALPDLASGQLDCSIDPPTLLMQHTKSGRIRAIAHTGDAKMEAFPDVPPFGALYPSAVVTGWQAVFAPATTPKALLARLNAEWVKVITSPDVARKIRDAGFEPVGDSTEAFTKAMAADYAKFGRIIKERNIRLD